MDLEALSNKDLLQLHAALIDELRRREVVRTSNNPVGDYAEWLVSHALGLSLGGNSQLGYDATDDSGTRFQIKGRRTTPQNKSTQLSAIRRLSDHQFDYLVAVIFDEHYDVVDARQIPHATVEKFSTYREHTNAHILHLKGAILDDPTVMKIDSLLSKRN